MGAVWFPFIQHMKKRSFFYEAKALSSHCLHNSAEAASQGRLLFICLTLSAVPQKCPCEAAPINFLVVRMHHVWPTTIMLVKLEVCLKLGSLWLYQPFQHRKQCSHLKPDWGYDCLNKSQWVYDNICQIQQSRKVLSERKHVGISYLQVPVHICACCQCAIGKYQVGGNRFR